jgi:hypothetical protein
VLGASNIKVIEAAITWAEAEANKLNRLDLAVGRVIGGVVGVSVAIVFVVLFINPLRNGVAAGELDRETANPGHVILVVLVALVAILDTTGLGEKLTTHSGVGRETITLDGFKTLLANCGGSGKGGCGDDALHG